MSSPYRRRMTPEELETFLGLRNSTVMATLNPDGSPHMTAVGYEYHDGIFSVSTTRDRVKYRNVAADKRVSLIIRGRLEEGGGETVVVVSGDARLSEDREEAVAMLRRLVDKSYSKDVADRLFEDRKDEPRVVISFRPKKTSAWLQIGRSALNCPTEETAMDFFEVVHTQRSIRRFKPDPVPDEAIWAMLDAAIRGPSGSNSQPWIWLVIRDDEKREIIARAVREHFEKTGRWEEMKSNLKSAEDPSRRRLLGRAIDFFGNVASAPVLIVPCLVRVTSPDTEPRSLLSGSSIYGAVQNMMLAARAQGLGTVLTTFNTFIEDELRSTFHLPDNAVPVCVVPVGYPDGQRFGPTTRKPVDTVTYWDDWGATASRPS